MLTLTVAIGEKIDAGPHTIELASSSPEGFAVVRWTDTRDDGATVQLVALEHGGEVYSLGAEVGLVISAKARMTATRCALSFDAPRAVPIYRRP